MSPYSGFDSTVLDNLARMVGTETAREITSLFFEHAPRRIADAVAHSERGDLNAVADELHALKSSAAIVGAKRLQELSNEGEHSARENDSVAVEPLLVEIEREYARVEPLLRDRGTA